jgi:hypothetical protein
VSQAIHIGTEYERQVEWFECPRCGVRSAVTQMVWASVPVIGRKPTLDACEHRPHVPPSPATLAAHERERELLDIAAIALRPR